MPVRTADLTELAKIAKSILEKRETRLKPVETEVSAATPTEESARTSDSIVSSSSSDNAKEKEEPPSSTSSS